MTRSPKIELAIAHGDESATMTASSNGSVSSHCSDGDEHPVSPPIKSRRRRGIKRVVKTLMRQHGGSTRHPRVSKMINKLETMNPTQQPVARSPLLVGDFVAHSSPDFPGRIRPKKGNEDTVQYTLGRLSFGIFQPHNLVCTITTVRNSIQACQDTKLRQECLSSDNCVSFNYPIIIDLTIHTETGDLPAELRHEALCYEIPKNEKRLGITFLGGTLMPTYAVRCDDVLLDLWKKTFADAYTKAEEERSLLGKAFRLMLKWWLKLSTPTDEDAENCTMHSVRYEMKRRPKGHLDVLYLDEDLRITRGNRGTISVVERELGDGS